MESGLLSTLRQADSIHIFKSSCKEFFKKYTLGIHGKQANLISHF